MADNFDELDKDEVQTIVHDVMNDCAMYCDGELSATRVKATEYYLGEPFGNEEEGRSRVVLTEVRDAISGMIPSVLRVFTGGERQLELRPNQPAGAKQAAQVTDFIMKALERQGFFLKMHAVALDGFVRAIGVVKWGYDSTPTLKWYSLMNVGESELEAIANDPGVKLHRVKETKPAVPPTPPTQENPQGNPGAEAEYSVTFSRKTADGCFRFWAIPPEEFLYTREARDVESALGCGHRTYKTRGELRAMGVSEDDLDEYGSSDDTLRHSQENVARREVLSDAESRDPQAGSANDKIAFGEYYVRVDADQDGEAELRKFLCIGTAMHIINGDGLGEPVNEAPFAAWCPYPEPHTITGQSVFTRVGDMQLFKSMLARAMADSLALSIFPRIGIVENQVNQGDVLNTDIGAPIRMKVAGAITPIQHDFVGREALGVLAFADEVIERRTGQAKGAQGLDSDALQSTTASAVGATLAMSQQQLELICRVFAEMLLKPLVRGFYRMYCDYRPKAETVRLRGKWIEMDARTWDCDMDVDVNVALGTTDTTKKIQYLLGVHTEQSGIIQQYGLSNPLCGLPEYRNTLDEISVLSGYPDSTPYFREIPDDWQPPAPAPDKPTPAEVQANAEIAMAHERNQRELAIKEAEFQLKKEQAEQEYTLEREKMAQEAVLRRYAIDAQWHTTHTELQFEQDRAADQQVLDGHKVLQDQAHEHAVAAHDQALKVQQQQHEQELAAAQQAHDQKIAQQQADQQPAPVSA
jgi:hypothetical protein